MPFNRKLLLLALLAAALLFQQAKSQQNCPSGEWIENGAFCYLLVNGTTGKSFDEARADCLSRATGADLLWITDTAELGWFEDYRARQWNIKSRWSQCTDCTKNVEAAWIGAYRSNTGIWMWTKDNSEIQIKINWYLGQPKGTPSDFVLAADTGSQIRYRSETKDADRKFWHFCKVQHREPTTSTTVPTTTLPPYLGPCPTRDWTEQGRSCYLLVKGQTGRTFEEARNDCRGRDSESDLLWIVDDNELNWFQDYNARRWSIKAEWRNCTNCVSGIEAAWIGAYREQSSGQFKWLKNEQNVTVQLDWWLAHPKDSPADFVIADDTGSQFRYRSETRDADRKFWHFCKVQHREQTTSTTVPTTTLPPYLGPCPTRHWTERDGSCYLLVKGATGRSFDEARADCRGRDVGSDLLWISEEGELNWFQDYNARQWKIKADWGNCTDCVRGIEGAWIGAYRDVADGQFKWLKDGLNINVKLDWWLSHPKASPADFVIADDTGSQIRYRSETRDADRKFWHFCKVQQRELTTSTTVPTTTLPPYLGPCPTRDWTERAGSCYLLVKGATGRSFDEARADCRGRDVGSDLLWISDEGELNWFQDYNARQWKIKADWGQCTDCDKDVWAAWVGASRVTGERYKFKWLKNEQQVSVGFYWWIGHPKPEPANYLLVGDTGQLLKFRTEALSSGRKFWHFCKTSVRG